MSFLSGLFKRKPGGTFVGNLIRGAANKASGGLLGNGAMILKPNEAPVEANNRLLQGVAAGVGVGQDVALTATPGFGDNAQQSLTKGAMKTYLPYIVGGVLSFIGLLAFILKRK